MSALEDTLAVDRELVVVAAADAGALPETVAIARTSWGIVEIEGLPVAELAALLRMVVELRGRASVAEKFAEEHGYDRAGVESVLDVLLERGILRDGAEGPPAIWSELEARPARPPFAGASDEPRIGIAGQDALPARQPFAGEASSGVLRARRRIAIAGEGALARAVLRALRESGVEARCLPAGSGTAGTVAVREVFAASTASPPQALDAGEPDVADAELIIFCGEDVPFERALAWQAAAAASGCSLLSVLCFGSVIDVGPLELPGRAARLTPDLRLPFLDLGAGGGEAKLALASALSFASARALGEGRLRACAELVVRVLSDPACSTLERIFHLGPDALLETPLPRAPLETLFLAGAPELDLRAHLDPRLLDPAQLEVIGSALAHGELVVIRDAFRPELAEAAYRALDRTDRWKLHEERYPYFHFHHHNIYNRADFPPEIGFIEEIFNSGPTVDFVEALTGETCRLEASVTPSWYMPGDHSTPHNDVGGERKIAYVWHLTKDWREDWGGELYWCASGTTLAPRFNTLVLFKVSRFTDHFVVHVAPHAQGKRLAINGWWRGETGPLAPEGKPAALDNEGKILALPTRLTLSGTEL